MHRPSLQSEIPFLTGMQPMEMPTTTTLMNETQLTNPYGFIRDGKIYLKAYMHFPDRQIGEVKISEETAIQYFTRRFELARQKVEELEHLVEVAENKGSYLMKLVHLREYLGAFDGLGDFPALFARLDVLEDTLRDQVAVNRVKNLEIKQALIAEALQTADRTDWKEATEALKDVKMRWIKTGSVDKDLIESIEKQFTDALNLFFDRRKDFFNTRIRIIKDRIRAYSNIIDDAQRLKNAENLDEASIAFKKLHERWKAVGKIPHQNATKLWIKFREYSDEFFEKYKAAKGLPNKTRPKVEDPKVVAQEKICEEIENLLVDATIEQGAERTKVLMMEWRNIGILPKLQRKDILERFRMACDKIFETNYLIRVIKRRHYDYDRKPVADQLRIKIAVMSDLVRKDKEQFALFENSITTYNRNQPLDRETQGKLAVQRRKISVKEILLSGYQLTLQSLKK